jgi:hypothetical protein
MSPLDESSLAKILACVTEPKASLSCRAWKDYLYDSLQLEQRIRFNQQMAKGTIPFGYSAVRPLGDDFEESVSYFFDFDADGTYKMQWMRTFDAWSSQSEQQLGKWSIVKDNILCETVEPSRPVSDTEVRFAPAGYIFSVAIDDILKSEGRYLEDTIGSPPKPWEISARLGGSSEENNKRVVTQGMWQTDSSAHEVVPTATAVEFHAPLRPDARFVEIDGEMHEVSGDIVANWPEDEWARLMKCRLRFGING